MPSPVFRIPTLLRTLGLSSEPAFATDSQTGPWASGFVTNAGQVRSLIDSLDLLYRGLNLAGYQTDDFAVGWIPAGAAQGETVGQWLHVENLIDGQTRSINGPWPETATLPIPVGAQVVMALNLRPRLRFIDRGPDFSVPLPLDLFDETAWMSIPNSWPMDATNAAFDFQFALQRDAGGKATRAQLAIMANNGPAPTVGEACSSAARACETVLAGLFDDLGLELRPGFTDPDPATPVGLLGVFDARNWTFARESWSRGEETLLGFGLAIHDEHRGQADDTKLLDEVRAMVTGSTPTRVELRIGRGRLFGGRVMALALGRAMRERYIDLHGALEPTAERFLNRGLGSLGWFDVVLGLHMLDLVDVLGDGPLTDLDPALAGRSPVDVTGFYDSVPSWPAPALDDEEVTVGPWPDVQTLQINQAGDVLTGFWQTRREAADGLVRLHQHRISASRRAGTDDAYDFDRILLTALDADDQNDPDLLAGDVSGSFAFTGDDLTITFTTPGRADAFLTYRRVSVRPHLSDLAIASMGFGHRDQVEVVQRWPPHGHETALWDNAISHAWAGLQYYLDQSLLMQPNVAQGMEADFVDRVRWCFRKLSDVSYEGAAHGSAFQRRASNYLATVHYTSDGDRRTGYAWMSAFFADRREHNPPGTTDVPHLENVLWVWDSQALPDGVSGPFRYAWVLSTAGISVDGIVGGGLAGGKMTITKFDADGDLMWVQDYIAGSANVSIGVSGGVLVQQESYGEVISSVDWSQDTFEGSVNIYGVTSAEAIDGGPIPELPGLPPASDPEAWNGLSFGYAGKIDFFGDGTFSPMTGPSTGYGRVAGLYVGVEASATLGEMHRIDRTVQPAVPSDELLERLGSVESGEYSTGDEQLFDVGEHELTSVGWLYLKTLAADHRAALETPWTFLNLIGHASTTGDAEQINEPLSIERAATTYDALRACLGPAFAVHEANTFVNGRGEYDASLETPPDTESDDWRRVDIWLDTNVLVRL